MKRLIRPNRRTCLRLTLLAVVSLLFQQMAFASYACSVADLPTGDAAMAAHCDGMPMAQQQHAPSLCVQHCARQTPTTQDARLPNVPPLSMPALLPTPSAWVALPVSPQPRVRTAARRMSGMPPPLRFRVLLI